MVQILVIYSHNILGFCYCVIGQELWGGGDEVLQLSEHSSRQPAIARAVEKKRKIVKMSLIVVILFGISWLPYHSYFIVIYFIPGNDTLIMLEVDAFW